MHRHRTGLNCGLISQGNPLCSKRCGQVYAGSIDEFDVENRRVRSLMRERGQSRRTTREMGQIP